MNEYQIEEITEGMEESFEVIVNQEMMDKFYDITGDKNPLHRNKEFAAKKHFPSNVVYGMLTASFLSTLAGVYLPGKYSLIHSVEVNFSKPVFVGDKLLVKGAVVEIHDNFNIIYLKVTITNQDGVKVCKGKMAVEVIKNE